MCFISFVLHHEFAHKFTSTWVSWMGSIAYPQFGYNCILWPKNGCKCVLCALMNFNRHLAMHHLLHISMNCATYAVFIIYLKMKYDVVWILFLFFWKFTNNNQIIAYVACKLCWISSFWIVLSFARIWREKTIRIIFNWCFIFICWKPLFLIRSINIHKFRRKLCLELLIKPLN